MTDEQEPAGLDALDDEAPPDIPDIESDPGSPPAPAVKVVPATASDADVDELEVEPEPVEPEPPSEPTKKRMAPPPKPSRRPSSGSMAAVRPADGDEKSRPALGSAPQLVPPPRTPSPLPTALEPPALAAAEPARARLPSEPQHKPADPARASSPALAPDGAAAAVQALRPSSEPAPPSSKPPIPRREAPSSPRIPLAAPTPKIGKILPLSPGISLQPAPADAAAAEAPWPAVSAAEPARIASDSSAAADQSASGSASAPPVSGVRPASEPPSDRSETPLKLDLDLPEWAEPSPSAQRLQDAIASQPPPRAPMQSSPALQMKPAPATSVSAPATKPDSPAAALKPDSAAPFTKPDSVASAAPGAAAPAAAAQQQAESKAVPQTEPAAQASEPRERVLSAPDDAIQTGPASEQKPSAIMAMRIIAIGDKLRGETPPEPGLLKSAPDAAVEPAGDGAEELADEDIAPDSEERPVGGDEAVTRDEHKKPPPPPRRPAPPSEAKRDRQKTVDETPRVRQRRPWWEELFAEDFIRATRRLTDKQVGREVDFIEESLGVAAGGVVLDLGCGAGYHAVELASRGYGVVGYDLSLFQLALAADVAHERDQKLNFLQGDMREMAFEEMFDGIYCWNTTFGYFEEEKNLAVAQRVFKALRPGGMFLLDVANRDYVVEHAPSQVWYEGDACVCMDDMMVDFITSRLKVKRSLILDDGRTRECTYSLRLYSLHEIGKLLHDVGFRVTEASGHTTTPGVFFGQCSPRLIVLAQRP